MKQLGLLFVILCGFVSCTSTSVNVSGDINGRILDKDTNMPVENCIVSIDDGSFIASSNVNGDYNFSEIEMGMHILSFNAKDYQPYNDSVKVVVGNRIKKDVMLNKQKLPVVFTYAVSEVKNTSARLNAIIESTGNLPIIDRGFYFGLSSSSMQKLTVQSSELSFNYSLSDLNTNTMYYYRAYASNAKGEAVGELAQFMTENSDLAEVETNDVEQVTGTTANLCATIKKMPDSGIASMGFYIGTDKSNLNEVVYVNEMNENHFSIRKNELQDNAIYYYQSFVESKDGIVVGEIKSFKTLVVSLPTVESLDDWIENGDYSTTDCYMRGQLLSDGNDPDTEYGFYYYDTEDVQYTQKVGVSDKPVIFEAWGGKLTMYYSKHFKYKAYAKNIKGIVFGKIIIVRG